ncbi:transcriptional regulator, AraC family [Bifidobacterium reuteri DSM 23975]|uniref:Transcriptional regulator, AraC family n=2 Tax=Bifidobacterium reuteri TaxID=983706 RepID=A0A087CYS8_9BIFI|nr:AraC family transcriptional regulator [Bifidobacterium reuteri]KFI88428.1 transcriptional regulator, AraC family [Bifidobacterium reuteri DSM 23975]
MFTAEASQRMFHVDRNLDYESVIDGDHHESWGCSPVCPAIVRVHTEMPAQDVPLHWHLGSELIYPRHGRVMLFIDGQEVTLNDGQLCLISPKSLHSIHPEPYEDGQCCLSITFDGEYLSRLDPGLSNRHLLQGVPLGSGCEYTADELVELCERIVECTYDESEMQLIRMNALLFALLCHIDERWVVDDETTSGGIAFGDIQNITEYMSTHFASGISIAQIAQRFGYSREYFSRMFKRCAGVTPDQYLTEIRLQSSVDDLLNGDFTIAQIAQRNGFSHPRSLARAFSARFGMTPVAFRRLYRGDRVVSVNGSRAEEPISEHVTK